MATAAAPPSEAVAALSEDEARSLFEAVVQRYLKMSSADFLTRLDSDYFANQPELEGRLEAVLFYLPLIRRVRTATQ